MKLLFILNDPPYGTERSYNGLRLANAVAKQEGTEVKVFLMGDAASCARRHWHVHRFDARLAHVVDARCDEQCEQQTCCSSAKHRQAPSMRSSGRNGSGATTETTGRGRRGAARRHRQWTQGNPRSHRIQHV
jgi:sulfur relay (sulfurtransferase) complex TusBCD TusD component (DsrE family)